MMRSAWWYVLVVMLCLGVASPVAAQGVTEAEKNAEKHHQEGARLFAAGEFAKAAEQFRAGYDAVPAPELLKSEAVAWFKAGNCAKSEELFSGHLQEFADLPASDRTDLDVIRSECAFRRAEAEFAEGDLDAAQSAVEQAEIYDTERRKTRQIAVLRTKIAEAHADRAKQEELARVEREKAEAERAERERQTRERAERAEARARELETALTENPQATGRGQRIAGWGLVGAGAAFLAYQTIINVAVAPPKSDRYEAIRNDSSQRDEALQLYSQLDGWKRREIPIWLIGGALVAGGTVTILTAPGGSSEQSIGVGPGSVHFTTRF